MPVLTTAQMPEVDWIAVEASAPALLQMIVWALEMHRSTAAGRAVYPESNCGERAYAPLVGVARGMGTKEAQRLSPGSRQG